MKLHQDELLKALDESLNDGSLVKLVLSKPTSAGQEVSPRIDVRPVTVRNQPRWQFSLRKGNQEVHENLTSNEAADRIHALLGNIYRDCLMRLPDSEWTARYSKRGKCSIKRQNMAPTGLNSASHNNTREYLIPDGIPVPFLIATGVMTNGGKVRAKYYRKFRQINRYVEFIRDVVTHLPSSGVLRIIDFGSGKSCLTFATHYYLTNVLERDVEIVGLDRRLDVVETCQQITRELNLSGLRFSAGDIADYKPADPIHMTISLHACDTATDDALAAAVSWNADVILAVPCCHHELAATLNRDATPLFSTHGIMHERFAELATDSVRASVLQIVGYKTDVVEFIDLEHTARNLLIRAIRRQERETEASSRNYRSRLSAFQRKFGLPSLHLQKKLEESGMLEQVDLASDKNTP